MAGHRSTDIMLSADDEMFQETEDEDDCSVPAVIRRRKMSVEERCYSGESAPTDCPLVLSDCDRSSQNSATSWRW